MVAAIGPFGHRSYSGDLGQRRPRAEHDVDGDRRGEGEGKGYGEDPRLTRSSIEWSGKAEEASRR